MRKTLYPLYIAILSITLLVSSCSQKDAPPSWLTGDKEIDQKLINLNGMLLEQQEEVQRYGIMEQMISLYRANSYSRELKLFLNQYLYDYPEDSYNCYYLLILGSLYEEDGLTESASLYYNRLLTNYDDLIIKGQSIHLFTLNKLLSWRPGSLQEIEYNQELLNRFSSDIDKGLIQYNLAKAYEKQGLWDESIDSYRKFLDSPITTIPGEPNVYNEVNHYLKFHYSKKDWTRETLDGLVKSIKYAIYNRSSSRLNRYMAEDFFMMGWGQDRYDPFTQIPMELAYFLKSSVWYNRNLESGSNDSEAYLRTGGWSYRINIWYLYFNRINYPIDPEINGRWEWAGIYFGDRL
jgi:tetratricopeptide (TPR) repeat protein